MPRLSVVVITYNEERNIERCLRSLRFADEVIVVDSFSDDRTVEIARAHADAVMQHAFDGDIPQRLRGFERASGEWLMYADADEEVADGLRKEILAAVASGRADGYRFPRKVFALGAWIGHGGWYPDHSLRLFRRDNVRPEHAEVHGGFAVEGRVEDLTGDLLHYTYPAIEDYLRKMNDYTSLQVSSRLGPGGDARIGASKLLLSPLSHYFRKFVSQRGYKDGMRGFILAALGAIYTLALYAKSWEYAFRRDSGTGELPPVTNSELGVFRRQAAGGSV